MRRLLHTVKGKVSILPPGYTQLEYIQASGTQYIDTGITGNQNTKTDIKYAYTEVASVTGAGRMFGCRQTSTNRAFAIGTSSGIVASSGNKLFWCFDNQSYYIINDINFGLNEWLEVTFSATEHTLNGVSYGDDFDLTTFTTPSNLVIFGFANGGTLATGYGKCAYCKIWNGTSLVRNYIPAKRDIDGELGMYDIANNTFYTNAGSGSFVGGPEV